MPDENEARKSILTFGGALDRLAPDHYKLSATELVAGLDTELGRMQYARLLGVIVKEPFADEFKRRPSRRTKARIGLKWKSEKALRKKVAGTWQYDLVRELASLHLKHRRRSLSNDETFSFLMSQCRYETNLGKFLFQAFHQRICATPERRAVAQNAVMRAKSKSDASTVRASKARVAKSVHSRSRKVSDPTVAGLSVGAASGVAVAVATLFPGPIGAAASPVVGGFALFLMQVGVKGFCDWIKHTHDAEAIKLAEEETETK